MFTPTRTALYLALSATVFAAGEATAGCKVISGTYMCASWIKGSEVCEVVIDAAAYGATPVSVTCEITGAEVTYPNGPNAPSVCPYYYPQLPPGDLTCDGSTGPPTIPAGAVGDHPWRIFGLSGVTMNGGSTASGMVGSNVNIALSGTNTRIYGDAHAVGTVTKLTGAVVTGITDNDSGVQTASAVSACSPYTTASDMDYLGPGASVDASGNLTISGGGSAGLNADYWAAYLGQNPYCFNNITLSGGSTLEFWDTTTIRMNGTLQSTGGSRLANTTPWASLTINSSAASPAKNVTLNGSRGNNVAIYAPSADIKFGIGANYSGSFVGKTVTASGASSINDPDPAVIYSASDTIVTSLSSTTSTFTCDGNGICTGSAEIGPPAGSTCGSPSGPPALDFTADQFFAIVTAEFDNESTLTRYQWCTLNGSTYSCTDLGTDPYAMCDGGEGYGD